MIRYKFVYKYVLNGINELKTAIVSSPKGETLAIVEFNNAVREIFPARHRISIVSIHEIA